MPCLKLEENSKFISLILKEKCDIIHSLKTTLLNVSRVLIRKAKASKLTSMRFKYRKHIPSLHTTYVMTETELKLDALDGLTCEWLPVL